MYHALGGREYQKRCLYSPFHRLWQSFISIEVCRDCIPAIASSCKKQLTLNRPGFLQIGMARRGQILSPLCNFCLNGPIDMKFGMQIVLGKISRYGEQNSKKIARKLLKTLISAFLSTCSIETGPSQEMP